MSDTGADTGAEDAQESSVEENAGGDETGESGAGLENALRRLKDENKGLKSRLSSFEAQVEEDRKASMTDHEKALEEARLAGFQEATDSQRVEVLQAKVVAAAAAAGYADPADAPGLLGKGLSELGDDKAINSAVESLAEKKPYLLAAREKPPEFEQGQQGKTRTDGDWLRRTMLKR